MDFIQHIAEYATEGVLALVVIGQIRLWIAHFKLREELARDYVRESDLMARVSAVDVSVTDLRKRVEEEMAEMRRTTTRILELVAEIRGKSNVQGNAYG